jgi:hypothetical protein
MALILMEVFITVVGGSGSVVNAVTNEPAVFSLCKPRSLG